MGQSNQRNDELDSWVQSVSNEDIKRYIQHRVLTQMQFYSDKSQECKSLYFKWTNTSIFISFLIPVVSVFSDGSIIMKAMIAVLGAAIAGITSYLSIHNYKNLWESYRSIREQTYSLLLFYFTSSGVFAGKQSEEQDQLLIELCEKVFKSESQTWKEIIGSKTE